jgi:hypothetical protein
LDKSKVQVDSNFDSSCAKQVCLESSSSNHSVSFGSFHDPIILDHKDQDWDRTFVGMSFARKLCSSLPTDTLLQLEDLRMAGYSKQQIMDTLRIPFVLPKDVVFEFIGSCSGCDLLGHFLQHCPSSNVTGLDFNRPGNSVGSTSVKCFKCLDLGHLDRSCLVGWRCKRCSKIGHIAHDCSVSMRIWRVKAKLTLLTNSHLSHPKVWVIKQKQTKIEANIPPGFDSLTPAISPPLLLLQATVQLPSSVAMATFPVNPLAFLPEGMSIDQGPADRKVWTDLVISSPAPLQHDKVAIAETNRFIPIHLCDQMRSDIRDMLNEAGHIISAFDDHPLWHWFLHLHAYSGGRYSDWSDFCT